MHDGLRLLIVEDEENIRRFVRISFEKSGMTVLEASTSKNALNILVTRKIDIIIVDLGLPDEDGKELIKKLRERLNEPILVLSARDNEEEKVSSLDIGADDYLSKPFGIPELQARIRALIRRTRFIAGTDGPARKVSFGEVDINIETGEVRRAGRLVHITPTEYRLLMALAREQGNVLTHYKLLTEVWGPTYAERTHYLRGYITQLRQKLELDPTQPCFILTEFLVGYKLVGATYSKGGLD
ncbi:response regulator [Escherichia coli]|nr:response regulator [Escherichia coli]